MSLYLASDWWRAISASAAVASLSLAVVTPFATASLPVQLPPAAYSADSPPHIRNVAERLLASTYYTSDRIPTAEVLIARLPPQLPLRLPTGEGRWLLGSAVRSLGERITEMQVVLDVPGSPDDVFLGYMYALLGQGWRPAPRWHPQEGGLQSSASPPRVAVLCKGESTPWVIFRLVPGQYGGPNQVDVQVSFVDSGMCSGRPAERPASSGLIPDLRPPAGVRMFGDPGGGGSASRWSDRARAQTTMRPADLEAHFSSQLQKAGWTRREGASHGALAWSAWAVPRGDGDRWDGFLYVRSGPVDDERQVVVEVQRVKPYFANGVGGGG